MEASEIAAEVDRLGPWITGFQAESRQFGGQYYAEYDTRIQAFLAWLGNRRERVHRILECGCLEGGHTSALAGAFPLAEVTAADVRPNNIAKAKLLMQVRNHRNVEFVQDDLDESAACLDRRYDAIVCIGLLYHLRRPELFLNRSAKSAPILWLWTIYCAETEATLTENERRGRLHAEPTEHPLSGARDSSFFPTLGSLIEMALAAGYKRVEIVDREITKNGMGPAVMLAATCD